jgi:hypothetical protein
MAFHPSHQQHSHKIGIRGPDLPLSRHWNLHSIDLQWPEPAAHREDDAISGQQKPQHRPRQERGRWGYQCEVSNLAFSSKSDPFLLASSCE